MYTTCIFCHKPLGANEIVEHFPVGRRLAFDAARGRLWVVCGSCERWNLTPLAARWEAVEECERSFRETKLRVSTDNIGLARLSEGLELVRIGAPQRPELAAWRYGDQFGKRRVRHLMLMGGTVATTVAVYYGAAALGGTAAMMSSLGWQWPGLYRALFKRPMTLRTNDGRLLKLRDGAVNDTLLRTTDDGSLHLTVVHRKRKETFVGDEAMRHARRIIPAVNRTGGSKQRVSAAVDELLQSKSPEDYVRKVAAAAGRKEEAAFLIDKTERLALEMALHEDAERRAIEGELAELEAAWREAEEIAAISDNLLLPEGVEEKLSDLKRRKR